MKRIVLLILLSLASVLNAQQFESGVILDSIPISNSTDESFTLYLPKSYNPNAFSPILFIFSPSGRGKKGVEVFVKAAETYNHILVCSNNSRNGSIDRNFAIAQRLFDHVFSTFTIDKKRIYLSGFSGGSRLASAIATLSGQIEGVIGCGAGFLPSPLYKPSTKDFAYVGLCGDRDMNYTEMIGVKKYFNRIKFSNTLFTFDGNHEWPPNKQVLMAFAWLETEAQKKGYLTKTNEELKTGYLKDIVRAKTAMKNNQPLLAVEHYERTVNTYGSFFNLDSVRQEFQNIKKNKAYTSALKSRENAFEKEEVLTSIFFSRFEKDYEKAEKANLKWWDKEFEKLNKQEVKADVQMIKMLERLRFKVFVMAYSKSNRDISTINQKQQDFCTSLISLLSSKQKKEE